MHLRNPGQQDWDNSSREFLRLPIVGEYLATDWNSDWYRVELVVHCPFKAEYAAEVYAVKVDHLKEMEKAFKE